MIDFEEKPLTQLLKNRDVFRIFEEEFGRSGWLNATVLLESESRIGDLYTDGTVPEKVLDRIRERLKVL